MNIHFDVVKRWLEESPALRDNDEQLCATIWYNQAKRLGHLSDCVDFLLAYSSGKFTSAESIVRARRKVQELHPHLRGESYKSRQEAGKNYKP